MVCTSYTHVAMKQRLFTSTVDPFIFLPTVYPYTAHLVISLPVLCLAFASSTPHSNLPNMLYAQSRLYPSPPALMANRPVPHFGPLTLSTDHCGPLPLFSQGARYLQIFVDDKSQYTAGILLSKILKRPLIFQLSSV
jgi:hypothetical protein